MLCARDAEFQAEYSEFGSAHGVQHGSVNISLLDTCMVKIVTDKRWKVDGGGSIVSYSIDPRWRPPSGVGGFGLKTKHCDGNNSIFF